MFGVYMLIVPGVPSHMTRSSRHDARPTERTRVPRPYLRIHPNWCTFSLSGLSQGYATRGLPLVPTLGRNINVWKKYNYTGKAFFKDANGWIALFEIFTNILQNPSLKSVYLVVNVLDECETDLPKLLEFYQDVIYICLC